MTKVLGSSIPEVLSSTCNRRRLPPVIRLKMLDLEEVRRVPLDAGVYPVKMMSDPIKEFATFENPLIVSHKEVPLSLVISNA
jgi:hypothetical protein